MGYCIYGEGARARAESRTRPFGAAADTNTFRGLSAMNNCRRRAVGSRVCRGLCARCAVVSDYTFLLRSQFVNSHFGALLTVNHFFAFWFLGFGFLFGAQGVVQSVCAAHSDGGRWGEYEYLSLSDSTASNMSTFRAVCEHCRALRSFLFCFAFFVDLFCRHRLVWLCADVALSVS